MLRRADPPPKQQGTQGGPPTNNQNSVQGGQPCALYDVTIVCIQRYLTLHSFLNNNSIASYWSWKKFKEILKVLSYFLAKNVKKIFKQKCILARHIQSEHQGVKFVCNQCEYQATFKGNLTKHIQSQHYGLKYVCDQCDNLYTDTNTLRKHIQSVHEGVKYGCQKCKQQFTVLTNLNRHMKNVHEMSEVCL